MLPCCIARCRVRARSGAPLVVCAVATGYQLWTWPPLGTGAALSCPVVPGVWVIWGSWWHEKHRIDASPARAALIRSMPPKVQTTSPKKRQKWAVLGEVVCDLGKSRNTANTTTHNRDFPAQHSRQVTTPATRCVQPSAYRTCRVAVVRTLRALVCPSRPHVGLLFRVWAVSSSRGPAIPSLGNPAHVRNSGLTCGTDGPRAKQRVHMRDALEPRSLSHTANP